MAIFTWKNPALGGEWADATQWTSASGGVPDIIDTAKVIGATGTLSSTGVSFGIVTYNSPGSTLLLSPGSDLTIADFEDVFTLTAGTLRLGPDIYNLGDAGIGNAFNIVGFGTIVDNSLMVIDQADLDSATTGQTVVLSPDLSVGGTFLIGAGTSVSLDGALTIGSTGTFDAVGDGSGTGGAFISTGSNSGLLKIEAAATVNVGSGLSNAAGAVIQVTGLGSDLFIDKTNTTSKILNSGTIQLSQGATLEVPTYNSTGGQIQFLDDAANQITIKAGVNANIFSGAIRGFVAGNTIDFSSIAYNAATDSLDISNGNTLQVHAGTKIIAKLTFPGIGSLTGLLGKFSLVDDTSGAFTGNVGGIALQSSAVACYAAGTRILTARGMVAIERIVPGDRVPTTVGGRWRAVIWTGRRHVRLAGHARPWDVQPVRVRAGAFGPGAPLRDLVLSPDHAIHDAATGAGALVPVRHLINGVSVMQEAVAEIVWHHLELDAHDVVLAEGLGCESYLDTGNRHAFEDNGVTIMQQPAFARNCWDEAGCAPLVTGGRRLTALRRFLHEAALAAGAVLDDAPAVHLVTETGRVIWPAGPAEAPGFALPEAAGRVWLVSRAGVPADVDPASDDRRSLGVAVAAADLDGVALDLAAFDQGWHAPEPGLRWTNGRAAIDAGRARALRLRLVPGLLRTWRVAEAGTRAVA